MFENTWICLRLSSSIIPCCCLQCELSSGVPDALLNFLKTFNQFNLSYFTPASSMHLHPVYCLIFVICLQSLGSLGQAQPHCHLCWLQTVFFRKKIDVRFICMKSCCDNMYLFGFQHCITLSPVTAALLFHDRCDGFEHFSSLRNDPEWRKI